jgi:hypothetical protein
VLVERCRLSDQEDWLFPCFPAHHTAQQGAVQPPQNASRLATADPRCCNCADMAGVRRGSRLPSLHGLCSLGIVIDATDALVDVGIDDGIVVVGPPRRASSPPRGSGRASCAGLALPTAGSQRAPVAVAERFRIFAGDRGDGRGLRPTRREISTRSRPSELSNISTVKYIGAFL